MDQRFGKKYKLCSRKTMDELFASGNSLSNYPFVIKYKELDFNQQKPFQIAISVPKRNFKRAPDRNRIKRMIREVVRKNKHLLGEGDMPKKQLALFLIYTGKEILSFSEIEHKIVAILERLDKKRSSK